MNRVIKLLSLIILSLSVYFIYQYTTNKNKKILVLGDKLSIELLSNSTFSSSQVRLNTKYARDDLSIYELLEIIKTHPEIKRDLLESSKIYLTLGYNDILYMLSLEEDIPHFTRLNNKLTSNYKKLLKEIRKYYKDEIIVIGYYKSPDYYKNIMIRKLNKYLKNNKEITYIDTYNILNNREKYFSNSNTYFPNKEGLNKIIKQTLAK